MRIALQSTLVNSGTVDSVIAEVARIAQYGFAGYWAPMFTGQDTLTCLALAGREVPDIELGTAIVPMPLRPPFALAQQMATVQEVVGGRLVVGIGTSHEPVVKNIFRTEWGSPLATARRYLEEIADIASATDPPRLSTAHGVTTPVLLGALNPSMIAVAAELAQGVVTWAAGAVTLRELVGGAVLAAGRDDSFRIVAGLPVCVTDDVASTRAEIARRFGQYDNLPSYRRVLEREGAASIADISIVGDAAEVHRRFDELAECGATDLIASVVGPTSTYDRTWEVLADYGRNSA